MTLPTLPLIPAPKSYSLVTECVSAIGEATNLIALDSLGATYKIAGSAFSALPTTDKDRVLLAWRAARAAIVAVSSLAIEDAIVAGRATVETTAPITNAPPVSVAEIAVPALTTIAAESTANARLLRAPRTARAQTRSQSPEQIATATLVARASGQTLAGYDGQIVDPTSDRGIGSIVQFGKAPTEMDLVSGRMRQILVRWSSVVAALASIGLPADHLGDVVSAIAHLGQATKILNHSGFIARNARNLGKARSSWIVGRVDTSVDSDTLGARECRIDLMADGSITLTNPDHPQAQQVVREFEARIASALIEASHLRARIVDTLTSVYGARDTDLGLYLSPYHTDRAVALLTVLRGVVARPGRRWIYVSARTSGDQALADALCESLVDSVGKLEAEIADSDSIKRIAGATLITRVERYRAECAALASVLGPEITNALRTRILACDDAITTALNATSLRAMNLELS